MRDANRIPLILRALERRWQQEPDLRLGQLLVNLLRDNAEVSRDQEGMVLFGLADGELLRWIGAETEDEHRYIREEPGKARAGWKEWEEHFRNSDTYRRLFPPAEAPDDPEDPR